MTIRVLIADDHPLILRGVEELLSSVDDMEVVGAESRPDQIGDAVDRLQPDVLVQDLSMAGRMCGLEVVRTVHAEHPRTHIVVLSMHCTPGSIYEAFNQGATAYVSKLGDMEELVSAVRSAHNGKRYLSPPFTEADVEEYGRVSEQRGKGQFEVLTKRELEVLGMVAQGRTSSEIAARLHIGRRTVESHRANLTAKLGVRNQAELVRYALERGLVADS